MLARSSRGGVPVFRRPALEAERLQRLGELARRRLAGAACRMLLRADVDQPVQERSGRHDERRHAYAIAVLHRQPDDPAVLDRESGRPCRTATRCSARLRAPRGPSAP